MPSIKKLDKVIITEVGGKTKEFDWETVKLMFRDSEGIEEELLKNGYVELDFCKIELPNATN